MTITAQTWQSATASPNPTSKALTNVVTAGSLCVCYCAITSGSTITVTDDFGDSVSWSDWIGPFTNTNDGADLFLKYKVVGTPSGAGTKKTATCTGSTGGFVEMAWTEYLSDVAVTWTTDGSNNAGTTISADPNPGSITTTGTGLVLGAVLNSSANPTAASGFTRQVNFLGFNHTSIEDQLNTASGSYTASWTVGSGAWRAFAAAFKATATASGGGPLTFGGNLVHGSLIRGGRLAA